jgi:hypothetical protein
MDHAEDAACISDILAQDMIQHDVLFSSQFTLGFTSHFVGPQTRGVDRIQRADIGGRVLAVLDRLQSVFLATLSTCKPLASLGSF